MNGSDGQVEQVACNSIHPPISASLSCTIGYTIRAQFDFLMLLLVDAPVSCSIVTSWANLYSFVCWCVIRLKLIASHPCPLPDEGKRGRTFEVLSATLPSVCRKFLLLKPSLAVSQTHS
jgi:hypothetical protein